MKAAASTWAGIYVFVYTPLTCSAQVAGSTKLAAQIDQLLKKTVVHAVVR